jgi:hypothetical protein
LTIKLNSSISRKIISLEVSLELYFVVRNYENKFMPRDTVAKEISGA